MCRPKWDRVKKKHTGGDEDVNKAIWGWWICQHQYYPQRKHIQGREFPFPPSSLLYYFLDFVLHNGHWQTARMPCLHHLQLEHPSLAAAEQLASVLGNSSGCFLNYLGQESSHPNCFKMFFTMQVNYFRMWLHNSSVSQLSCHFQVKMTAESIISLSPRKIMCQHEK